MTDLNAHCAGAFANVERRPVFGVKVAFEHVRPLLAPGLQPGRCIEACLALCGVASSEDVHSLIPRTSRIADTLSDEWCRRYRQESRLVEKNG